MKRFRNWLIAQLAETRHARVPLADDDELRNLAHRLGLQPDVLAEARVRAKTLGVGRSGEQFEQRQGETKLLLVGCPEGPALAWKQHAATWGIDPPTLLRSLVYAYLCGTYEPPRERLSRFWLWEGRHVKITRSGNVHNGRPELVIQGRVKYGAYLVLLERARRLDHTMTALLRALILENMDGKFGQRGALTIMDLRSMPGDPEFYFRVIR